MRPMKGNKVEDHELSKLKFPMALSPKLDGIRCLMVNGKALSASLKPIPNDFVRQSLEANAKYLEGADGELMLDAGDFSDVQSAFMSKDGYPNWKYCIFDTWNRLDDPFELRVDYINEYAAYSRIEIVHNRIVHSLEQLLWWEDHYIRMGYEGVMLRRLDLPYKFGKASINQGHLLKRKPMDDSECIVVGFEEQQENQNEATTSELGLTKRSSCKDGKIGKGTLGKFIVWNPEFGYFKIGTGRGLTDSLRQTVWNDQDQYYGKFINFSFQRIGTKDKPRLPIFRYFRDVNDMDLDFMQQFARRPNL